MLTGNTSSVYDDGQGVSAKADCTERYRDIRATNKKTNDAIQYKPLASLVWQSHLCVDQEIWPDNSGR
jgi:Tfp pilus assembly major pilin PilA